MTGRWARHNSMITAEQDMKNWLVEVIKPDEMNDKDFLKTGVFFEAVVPKNKIVEIAGEFLAQGYFLESLTAVDFAECLAIVYHFNRWDLPKRACIKIVSENLAAGPPADALVAEAPSISHVYDSADWFEREIFEFFGVHFEGHPNLKRLF